MRVPDYTDLVERLRRSRAAPLEKELMNEAADAIEELVQSGGNGGGKKSE